MRNLSPLQEVIMTIVIALIISVFIVLSSIFIFKYKSDELKDLERLKLRIVKLESVIDYHHEVNLDLMKKLLIRGKDDIKMYIFDYTGPPYFASSHIFIDGNWDQRFNIFREMIELSDPNKECIFHVHIE